MLMWILLVVSVAGLATAITLLVLNWRLSREIKRL